MEIKMTNSNWEHYGYGDCTINFKLNDLVIGIHTKSIPHKYFEVFVVDRDDIPSINIERPKDWQFLEDEELINYVIQQLDKLKEQIKVVQSAFIVVLDDKLDFLSQERTV